MTEITVPEIFHDYGKVQVRLDDWAIVEYEVPRGLAVILQEKYGNKDMIVEEKERQLQTA